MTADNEYASISQGGMACAEQPERRGCCGGERVTYRVPDIGVQRLIIIRNEKDAAIRQQSGVNGSGGPVGNRGPLALGGSLGVTAYCYCNYEQKK
jgi:hypothetical protein